jgi:hypothetical protein
MSYSARRLVEQPRDLHRHRLSKCRCGVVTRITDAGVRPGVGMLLAKASPWKYGKK